jgi:histidinol dehydrogenase
VKIIHTTDQSFDGELARLRAREATVDREIRRAVEDIISDVARRGDEALFEYTKRFDGTVIDGENIEVSADEIAEAVAGIDESDLSILQEAARRIEVFHRKQIAETWLDSDEEGIELGQLVTPIGRVGIYAPGGRAAYPSTVLMAAIPAKVAGVGEIYLVSPAREGTIHPLVLAAARLSGVDRVFRIGGAQAVAALAYGTESVPPVDKIVGPGNVYVATAKMIVFGKVGIDMIAGPSEIVIISDGTADAAVAAADLLSQAEHDPMASALLLTPSAEFARRVAAEVQTQLSVLTRQSIARAAIEEFGAVIVTRDMDEAVNISNSFAPEHLELMVENPRELLHGIRNAGAVFLGLNTPEAVGDYMAGPNHILPTGGTARFSSPLGVYDFVKRTSVISFSPEALRRYGRSVVRFAELEGLEAHGRSVLARME